MNTLDWKKWNFEVIAHDFNSPPIRNYLWTKAICDMSKEHNIHTLVISIISRKNKIDYIGDMETWTKAYESVKKQLDENINILEELIDKTNKMGELFNEWTEKNIFTQNLVSKSNEEINELFQEFVKKQAQLYTYGVLLPLMDFSTLGSSFIEYNVKKVIEEKVKQKDVFEVFTHPIHNSFAEDQETDLLILMRKHFEPKWTNDIKFKSKEEIKQKYPEFWAELESHTKKHAWVYFVYMGPAFTEDNFLEFIRDYLKKEINPAEEINRKKKERHEIEQIKKKILEETELTEFERTILEIAGKFVWSKPRRKDYQSKSYYHFEKLVEEIARRLEIEKRLAWCIPSEDLMKYLDDKAQVPYLESIYELQVCLPNEDGTYSILVEDEAKSFLENDLKKQENKIEDVDEIKGNCAMPGTAKGIVKIINSPADLEKMEDGNILVSIATTPSIVTAMKKAAAIVTDEGGLTCHASIVSRELGITCVVGTKIASKVFKDGDEVEVDAKNGIIRKIKNESF